MKEHNFTIDVTDHQRAYEIRDTVHIGHYFVFASDDKALAGGRARAAGRFGRLLAKRAGQARVLPLLSDPVRLAGVTITPGQRAIDPLACVVTERDVYRAEQDTVHLFMAAPARFERARLVIEYSGAPFAEREVYLPDGVAMETLAMLLPGSYTAQLAVGSRAIGQKAAFTVAEYTLAPLSARLLAHRIDRQSRELDFELALDSYQVPFADRLVVSLVEAARELRSVELDAVEPGRYCGAIDMSGGDGPFRLRLRAASDAERVAEVVIPGSRARERDLTVVSELGQERLFSMMPEPGALPVRGGYLSDGDVLSTPLTVAEVVSDRWAIEVRAQVDSLVALILDLETAMFHVDRHGRADVGSQIAINSQAPACLVLVGGFVDGRPFEAFTTFIRPSKLGLEVATAETARPGERLAIELRSAGSGPVPVLLSVRDQRLTATDTPEVRLGAALKAGIDRATETMADQGVTVLADVLPPDRPYLVHDVVYSPALAEFDPMDAAGFGDMEISLQDFGAAPASLADDVPMLGPVARSPSMPIAAEATRRLRSGGLPREGAVKGAMSNQAAPPALRRSGQGGQKTERAETPGPRAEFPEVLFYGIVPVKGREEVSIALGDSLATFTVEAFALSGGDWMQARTSVVVDQPVRVDLELPPAVHPQDHVVGRLRAATSSGRARVSLTCDGQPVALRRAESALSGSTEAIAGEVATPVELELGVAPGRYVATVEDPTSGQSDSIELDVARPGKFRSYARELGLLQPGDAITLDSADALTLRVLPALDESFGLLLTATAGYAHLCCEQTAAKILAATFMYLASDKKARRKKAEDIILAGVAREHQMILPGRGFAMYPGQDTISDHYSQLAVRYLWKLDRLDQVPDLSQPLRQAARDGIALADLAGRAHRMSRIPRQVATIEDAYTIAAQGGDTASARAYIDRVVDLSAMKPRDPCGAVQARSTMAYAAAALLAVGEWQVAIPAANYVTRQFNEQGRLYSTVDSVAAITLMIQLRIAGLVSGRGRLRVNGRDMTPLEASQLSDQVETVEVLDGVAGVEVTRMVEQDWTQFSASFPIKVGFRDPHGQNVRRFRTGDRADLVVSLPDGYQAGDLLHVSLPACMSWIHGGGKVKRFTVDFAGKDLVSVPIVVTSPIAGRQHFAACVRNMFEEERAASPGLIAVQAG